MDIVTIISDNPLSALLGLLFSAWLGYRLAIARDLAARRLEAGSNIADSFRPELNAIEQKNQDVGRFILTVEAYRKHDTMIRANKKKLSWYQRIRLEKAWRELAYHPEDSVKNMPFYEQYFDGGSLTKRSESRRIAASRIQRILEVVE